MIRTLFVGVFIAGVMLAAGSSGTIAQDKKDPPKKRERIALNEPKEVAKDPDFAIQGEYVGELPGGDGKMGIQVVAKGEGKFAVKSFVGGLPGDGWDGKTILTGTAERKDGKVIVTVKDVPNEGVIADGAYTHKTGAGTAVFKKVERKSATLGKKPPSGAVILFGAEGDEKNWEGGKIVELSDGKYLNVGVKTKQKFQGFTAHIEFRLPWMPNSTGQGRGNSGVYLQDRYECQVLDSFGLSGENNECGGIYTQHKPSVNMCYPPMSWQTYDMEFTPAQFEDGKKTKNGRATIYHNGVKIHDNIEFPKECPGGQKEEATPGPFQFQNHGDPVVYRNVWVVPAK